MAPTVLTGKLGDLLALFHRGSLDVPDNLIVRDCVFRLNGTAYEHTLGRPVSDPLVRLLGRGPAAYRFLAQGLRYAVPDARVALGDLLGEEKAGLVTGVATLSGTPRGSEGPLTAHLDVALVTDAEGRLVEVGVQLADDVLQAVTTARSR